MKRKDTFETTLKHSEILNYAILYMIPKCEEHIVRIKSVENQSDELREMLLQLAKPYLSKLKKLCDLYKIETGEEYELRASSTIDISDLTEY